MQALVESGDHVSTLVFEVNSLVFVPLFLSEYVGSARMTSRPFPTSLYEASLGSSRSSEEATGFPAPAAFLQSYRSCIVWSNSEGHKRSFVLAEELRSCQQVLHTLLAWRDAVTSLRGAEWKWWIGTTSWILGSDGGYCVNL